MCCLGLSHWFSRRTPSYTRSSEPAPWPSQNFDRNRTPNKMGSVDDQLFVAVKLTTLIPCTCFFWSLLNWIWSLQPCDYHFQCYNFPLLSITSSQESVAPRFSCHYRLNGNGANVALSCFMVIALKQPSHFQRLLMSFCTFLCPWCCLESLHYV